MTPTHELLTSAYAAFNVRDIDAVLSTTHPDVDWATNAEGDRILGHDQVRKYWMRQWSAFDFDVTPLMFTGSERGKTMVVDVHQVVRGMCGKVILEQMLQQVFSIRDGLIERIDVRKSAAPVSLAKHSCELLV
jgi:hypothetical protein